jgi:hypothetical protein
MREGCVVADTARPVIAVAHTLLVIAYHLISRNTTSPELGHDYYEQRDKAAIERRCIRQLGRLGLKVTVAPKEGAA